MCRWDVGLLADTVLFSAVGANLFPNCLDRQGEVQAPFGQSISQRPVSTSFSRWSTLHICWNERRLWDQTGVGGACQLYHYDIVLKMARRSTLKVGLPTSSKSIMWIGQVEKLNFWHVVSMLLHNRAEGRSLKRALRTTTWQRTCDKALWQNYWGDITAVLLPKACQQHIFQILNIMLLGKYMIL